VSIFDDVSEGLKAALRARDSDRLRALRAMRAAFLNEQKTDNRDTVSDEDCLRLLRRLEKQRLESIEAFAAAEREDRAEAERAELLVIREFLPSLANEAQTRAWVQEAIDATGASSAKEAGKVMGAVMKAHRGDVDGNLARRLAEELLG
jgi:uncharacterized protein YqeY